jgi:hypothetical protein
MFSGESRCFKPERKSPDGCSGPCATAIGEVSNIRAMHTAVLTASLYRWLVTDISSPFLMM